jgi:tRNA A37 methylthiotransferase MiaB
VPASASPVHDCCTAPVLYICCRPPLVVGVLGCMAERLKARLLDQQKLADLVVGPDAYRDLPRIIAAVQVRCKCRVCL